MWNIIGHERAVASLQSDISEGRAAHAYLISGPAGIGKGALASGLARALNCEAAAAERPCGHCRACERIAAGKHADVEIVTPRSLCDVTEHDHSRDSSPSLRICQVRRLERDVARTPFEGRTRVVIIDPADALTVEAANAFLKTLEEPPPSSTLILLASSPEAVLPTVRSRCRALALGPVRAATLRQALIEGQGASEAEADRLARLAEGRSGWALAALADEGLIDERLTLMRRMEALAAAPRDERLAYAEEMGERWPARRDDVLAELAAWQAWWRDVLLARVSRADLVTHQELADAIAVAAEKYTPLVIVDALEAVRKAVRQLEENANARLALEVLMLSLPLATRPTAATIEENT